MATSPRLFRNDRWQDFYTHFLASISNPGTRNFYGYVIRRFFLFTAKKYGHVRSPDRVTQADIEEFLSQPAEHRGLHHTSKQISPFTHNSYLTPLRTFYSDASKRLIEFRKRQVPLFRGTPPTEHIKVAKTGDVDRDMTEEEVTAFFKAIPRDTLVGKRDFALFYAAIATGRRRAELVRLLRGDLEQVTFCEDGHNRLGWRYWFRGKRRVTRESAEMPEAVVEAIRVFYQATGRDFATAPPETPLFFGVTGPADSTKPMALTAVDRRFRKYARMAGIPERIVFHSLRWENAYQRCLANNNDIIKTMDEIGWKNITMAVHYIRRRRRKEAGDPTAAKVAAKFAHL